MMGNYIIGQFFGYFFVMLVFMILGIIFAKRPVLGWILYIIGGVLQLISLIGNARRLAYYGLGASNMGSYWVVYIVIMVICGVVIMTRHSKAD